MAWSNLNDLLGTVLFCCCWYCWAISVRAKRVSVKIEKKKMWKRNHEFKSKIRKASLTFVVVVSMGRNKSSLIWICGNRRELCKLNYFTSISGSIWLLNRIYLDSDVAVHNHSIAFCAIDFHWYHFVRWFVSSAVVVIRLHARHQHRMDRFSMYRWFVGAHETISIDSVWCVSRCVHMMRNYTTVFCFTNWITNERAKDMEMVNFIRKWKQKECVASLVEWIILWIRHFWLIEFRISFLCRLNEELMKWEYSHNKWRYTYSILDKTIWE